MTNGHGGSAARFVHSASNSPDSAAAPGSRSSWGYFFYTIAVFAAFLGVLGLGGIFPAAFVLVFWALVFFNSNRVRIFAEAVAPFVVLMCCGGSILPAVDEARESANRMICSSHFKGISMALRNYHDTYGSFPPAYVGDENGKPMHSWRVLILPFIEQSALYARYRFDEPWNGPNNAKLAAAVPQYFQCPSQSGQKGWSSTSTNYMAIVGSGTAWPAPGTTTINDVVDGIGNTLQIMESDTPLSNWMEPKDLTLPEAIAMLSHEKTDHCHHSDTFFYSCNGGCNASTVDSGINFLSNPLPRALAEDLLLIDNGSPNEKWYDELVFDNRIQRYHYGNYLRVGALLAIIFFPTPWVWSGRRKNRPLMASAPDATASPLAGR